MISKSKTPGIYHLIDAFVIAKGGTNKEKTKKGIGLIISVIVCVILVRLGLAMMGFNPNLTGGWTYFLRGIMGKIFTVIFGLLLIILAGLPAIALFIGIIFLIISSLKGLIKHNDSEGSPLAAFLVNLIGFLVIIALSIVLFI